MKLYVLDHGKLSIDKGLLDGSRQLDTFYDPNAPVEMVEYPVYTVLIDHPEGKVLFDTACHPDSMKGHWPDYLKKSFPYHAVESQHLLNRLEQLNLRTEDIDYVIISHLHFDHAGSLEMFPNSKIIVHEDELSNTMENYLQNTEVPGYVREEIKAWEDADLQWKTVPKTADKVTLMEGIDILNYGPGHSYGMLGLHIQLPSTGSIVLASDAIYSKMNYVPPIQLPSSVFDPEGYKRTIEQVKLIEEQYQAQIWFGHDVEQFQSLIKSTEGFYE